MKKGERIPEAVKEFVRNLHYDNPGLSYRQIKERTEAVFEGVEIDKSSVGNILGGQRKDAMSSMQRHPATQPDLGEHRKKLLVALEMLEGFELFPLHDRDLATFWSRPNEADWPIPKGRVWRKPKGRLVVTLNAESRPEWPYLRQHLAQDDLWKDIEDCKEKLARDIMARFQLIDAVAERIRRPREEGGLALANSPELGFVGVTRPEVTIYYVFTIFYQVLSQCLELPLGLKRQDEFVTGDVENTIFLGGIPVIRLIQGSQREEVIQFLLRAQADWVSLPESLAAAQAYRVAKAAIDGVNRIIDRLRLTPGFSPGSKCELCDPFVKPTPAGTGIPLGS